ncbi:class I SAM-dependent methyltransferase [Candidatus Reidiella endopervernicosa]|uniref:Class I SAM-dependent methyltransferase n=1 Tax=Candidatus Reidiella endopervernicosa TaxID=2738883 RepID=A0A6N0HV83_9GAMM|nr:class I SAM-dependent methyltransferase [Candidatus Reidiella endopervernicosa]QKQ26305.1 class I SAM-dependent methyltransferase [Candidatus Reidiella endopervernicosa]
MPVCCRSCGEPISSPFLRLGDLPLVDRLVDLDGSYDDEPRFPLELVLCEVCGLVQITETVEPERLFCDDYPYYSSYSSSWLDHAQHYAEAVIAEHKLNAESLVVELASNDGYLLRNFKQAGIPVLGIDPAEGPAAVANKQGIETRVEFFDTALAARMAEQGQSADLIVANNVLAHVADLNGFVAGMATLLKPTGVITIEVPYLDDLVQKCAFDTIYHEHFCYFSVTALNNLFTRHGLSLNRVDRLRSHGGSLRLYVEHMVQPDASVDGLLEREVQIGITRPDYFKSFTEQVSVKTSELKQLLKRLRGEGKKIAAYGAAAKGVIMLEVAGIGSELIDYVVDRNPNKQGKGMPGSHIPIYAPEHMDVQPVDCLLILPWNLRDEIVAQLDDFSASGGAFIVALPTLELFE